ncbi:ABC transporter ATP-binding protein [Rudaeicoccus suwonensis]|uniref:Branched-chain amino acid transport system ATP-binding protein n=1 Tax=Rudaeicoccus suwonensis TaxID=657409 RepID=A0A561DWY8_9MICO|nr:ABC transporter ATP-binding protein [Rudaeicoccus suwonensis]TWE07877.1 branched-chain amino acid transport system ATP-binding protein [Rudaeicoccus suwonensis]
MSTAPTVESAQTGLAPLLEITGLSAGYGAANVLHDIDLSVQPGEAVVVLGANGAGKTTLLRAISGLIPHNGSIRVDATDVGRIRPDVMLRMGIAHVPQGRGTLTDMTIQDNLKVGAVSRKDARAVAQDIDQWYSVFPALGKRRRQIAGTLSGGEQQMLALARAMMARPRLLLCDEVSLGLAPLIVQGIFEVLTEVNATSGTALLLVEQNAELALAVASRVYLLEVGSVAAHGPSAEFRNNDAIRRAYLGY